MTTITSRRTTRLNTIVLDTIEVPDEIADAVLSFITDVIIDATSTRGVSVSVD